MTPPLSLRAFGHRVLVALLICCVLTTALWVAVLHAENAKIAKIPTANIRSGLLHVGRQLPDHRFRHAGVRRHEGRRRALREQAEPDRASAPTRSWSPTSTPGKHTGVLVSFPRDLWVAIPGTARPRSTPRSRTAARNSPSRPSRHDFDIPISHYLEVDFAGFRDIVNAIGSVPIYFPAPLATRTAVSRSERPGATTSTVTRRSRTCVRATTSTFANGQWQYDPTSDLGRIHRQQYFIRSLVAARRSTRCSRIR